MVLGIARPRLRTEGPRLFALRHAPIAFSRTDGWNDRRGTVAFEALADIIGGFPGFADHCCYLQGVQIRITSNYLLVNELNHPGFGIPIHGIEGTSLIPASGNDETALRVYFRENCTPRSFTITFRSNRLVARSARKAARAQHALQSIGVDDRFAAVPPLLPNFSLPWDQTREIENENVIWNGRAQAPIRVGSEVTPSDVWLTTKSIIWGSGNGEGINRIPLAFLQDMVSTRIRDRLGTPVIYLAIGNDHTGRFELPFLFDLEASPDRNFRERGAFLVGLRSRGLPDGNPAASNQPWRGGDAPDPADQDESENAVHDDGQTPTTLSESEIQPDIPAQEEEEKHTATFESESVPDIHIFAASVETTQEQDNEGQEDPTERFTLLPANEPTPETSAESADDVLLAEWSGPEDRFESWSEDLQIAVAWHDREIDYRANSTEKVSEFDESAFKNVGATPDQLPKSNIDILIHASTLSPKDGWAAIRQYEEIAIGALSDTLRVINGRINGDTLCQLIEATPSSWEQAQALAELATLYTSGTVTPHIAASRRERILALGDVCVRLRTLVELHDGDYLSAGELEDRRVKLMTTLSNSLVLVP